MTDYFTCLYALSAPSSLCPSLYIYVCPPVSPLYQFNSKALYWHESYSSLATLHISARLKYGNTSEHHFIKAKRLHHLGQTQRQGRSTPLINNMILLDLSLISLVTGLQYEILYISQMLLAFIFYPDGCQ